MLLALLTLLGSQPALAVPPGTVISNTATLAYSVNNRPGGLLNSNTEQFTVVSPETMNRSTINFCPFSCRLYAATTHSTTLDLINSGSNTLASHRVRITAPRNSRIELSGSGLTLIANTDTAATTSSLYALPDLAPAASQNLQLSLTLPGPIDQGNQQLTVEHLANGGTINSTTIALEVLERTASTLEILQYSHSAQATPVIIGTTLYQDASGGFLPTPVPDLPDAPGVGVTDGPVSLEVNDQFSHRQIIFLRVIDHDHNLNRTLRENVLVHLDIGDSGERECLQLRETGADTGIFTGYTIFERGRARSYDGHLDAHPHTRVAIRYQDEMNGNGDNLVNILIDPYGEVFDSTTGQALEGFTVRMINSNTGLPATVHGDDGISSYPAAMTTGSPVTDSSGQVYTYTAGEYRFPFAPAGNYKLVVDVPSGARYTWPSTKPAELLEKLPLEHLEIVPGSRGETFTLVSGPPLHIDIPVDPLTSQMFVQRSANRESVAPGDFIRYSVSLENTTSVPLGAVVLTETLPPGFRLQKGSVAVNGNSVAEPAVAGDGATLIFDFGALAAGEVKSIEYLAAVGAVKQGVAMSSSHAVANAGAAESNLAEHAARVFDELMRDRALLMGQVILDDPGDEPSGESDLAGMRIYMEDGRYAITDERGMFHFDNVVPGSHVVQFDLDTLPAEYEMVPTEKNSRYAGRAWSTFVDVQGGALWRTDFHIIRKPGPNRLVEGGPGRQDDKSEKQSAAVEGSPPSDAAWLLPAAGEVLAIPSANITIKHHREHTVRLTVNGEPVPEVNFTGVILDPKGPALSSWKGVDLAKGDNLFKAAVTDQQGRLVSELHRNLHFSGPPVRAEIVAARSTLIADGATTPVVAIRLYDQDGFPVHAGVDIDYNLNHPHQPARVSDLATVNMPGAPGNRTMATVGEDGIALIRLEPSNDTDDLVITLPLAANKAIEVKTRLKPQIREWILVGIAEGTAGYNTLSGNVETLEGAAAEDHLYVDDRIAFFAKGRVLGKWLLTMAYDTDKERPQNDGHDPRLFQAIDPGSYYTIFGDAGQYGFGASSTEKLYLKLERDEFYLLFGDYETGLTDTKLARYERTLTGIKSRYQDETYNLILFASESDQTFVKDEFRGQGGSGLYRLSRGDVAMNTDKVTLEVRDRFRSEVIVSSRELSRHLDYDIDYRDGTITFREPVFSTDANLDPQFIIVRYEAYGGSNDSITAGGRAEVKINDRLRAGVTQVSEGRPDGEALLGGADVQYRLNDNLTLRIEAANANGREETADLVDGNARLIEVEHQTLRSSSKFYFHETDPLFGLGQTNAGEIGMRKGGVESMVRAADTLNIKAQAYLLENRIKDATRNLAEILGERTFGQSKVRAGLREVRDEPGDGSKQRSEQITAGLSRYLFDNKVVLRADHDFNLNSGNDSLDFPDRTRLGADYHVSQDIALFAEQELSNGETPYTSRSRMGVKTTPWNGGELYSGVTRSSGDSGGLTSASLAGRQKWQLNQAWSIDAGAEESKPLNRDSGLPFTNQSPVSPFNLNSGFAVSDFEEFIAGSLGLTYSQEDLLWATRLEARNGDSEDRRYVATSVQTSPKDDLSLLAAFSFTQSDRDRTGEELRAPDLVLGVAYRPRQQRRWLLLDKLELKTENVDSTGVSEESWRIINLFHANYKKGRCQTSFQYGAKTVHETINAVSCNQFIDLTAIESRYDITKEWDVGLHGSILHAWDLNHYDFGSGISLGYLMVNNCWISLGYNFTGFRDEDFSRHNYTSKGVFLKFLIKFDQQSVREGMEWLKK
ncbi:MAG: DUF11 domain-containing protein [Deltaproteobacteria bacterium]|nr:DUF11 domain-containing protein [Deltaproteobacteria bacterium]